MTCSGIPLYFVTYRYVLVILVFLLRDYGRAGKGLIQYRLNIQLAHVSNFDLHAVLEDLWQRVSKLLVNVFHILQELNHLKCIKNRSSLLPLIIDLIGRIYWK